MEVRDPYRPPAAVVADIASPAVHVVSVLSYIALCFLCVGVVVLAAVAMNLEFGWRFPVLTGLLALVISICVSAGAFAHRHHRHFLATERTRFMFGCFIAFWLFDDLPGVVVDIGKSATFSSGTIASILEDSAIELLCVWLVVRFVVPWVMTRQGAIQIELSPNKSLERTRGG
jgi:hypothetical protein